MSSPTPTSDSDSYTYTLRQSISANQSLSLRARSDNILFAIIFLFGAIGTTSNILLVMFMFLVGLRLSSAYRFHRVSKTYGWYLQRIEESGITEPGSIVVTFKEDTKD